MQTHAIKSIRGWRTLFLLAVVPALTNCSRIDGSVELNNSNGEPYSFAGATVEVFDMDRTVVLAGEKTLKGLGRVDDDDGAISLQVITATIDDDALYDVEIRCPVNNTTDACDVESPLHVVLSGTQLKASGWTATALSEAIFHNIAYYATVEYSAAEITQMLDTYASGLLVSEPPGAVKTYNDVLAWNPVLTNTVKRPGLLNNVSELLAAGISNNDIKLLARQWVSPSVAKVDFSAVANSLIYHIRIVDNYAYLSGEGFGLRIVDISDPEHPVVTGQTGDVGSTQPVVFAGNVAYVQGENAQGERGVQIVDISNPQQPTVVGQLPITGTLRHVSDAHAYVTTNTALQIFNISNPQQPALAGQIAVSDIGNMVISGDYVYLIAGETLRIFNISNPATPTTMGALPISNTNNMGSIEVSAGYAYVTSYDFMTGLPGLSVVDISNPSTPTLAGQLDLPSGGAANAIEVSSRQVYISAANWVLVIDANDPTAPVLSRKLGVSDGSFMGLAVAGNFVHAIERRTGYSIIDPSVATPTAVQSGSLAITGGATGGIASSGHYAYLPGRIDVENRGILVVDLINPVAPALTAFMDGSVFGSLAVSGDLAFLGNVEIGAVQVADISNPLEPIRLPGGAPLDGAWDNELFGLNNIALYGNTVFAPWGFPGDDDGSGVTVGQRGCTNPNGGSLGGLFAVDIATPEALVITSHICMPEEAQAVAASGNHAYVAVAGGLLQVVDYSNPAQPVLAGSAHLSAAANFVAITGHHVWITEGSNGVDIIDVSNPAAPVVVASINTPGYARHVAFDEHYAYVADGSAGLLIFDIANPATPTLVASTNTRSNAHSVFLVGGYLYSGTPDGIEVFKAIPGSL